MRHDPQAGPAEAAEAVLEQVLGTARTHSRFSDREVPDALLVRIYDLARMGPTSVNGSPMRIVFVKSPEARARLLPGVKPGNVPKVESAPVTAIFGIDYGFYRHFDRLSPHNAQERIAAYSADSDLAHETAFRNATLQAAYFLIVARAMGLDCGPMSGFLHDVVDEAFFRGTEVKSNFLMNLGYGLGEGIRPRAYRFAFDEVCRIE